MVTPAHPPPLIDPRGARRGQGVPAPPSVGSPPAHPLPDVAGAARRGHPESPICPPPPRPFPPPAVAQLQPYAASPTATSTPSDTADGAHAAPPATPSNGSRR